MLPQITARSPDCLSYGSLKKDVIILFPEILIDNEPKAEM